MSVEKWIGVIVSLLVIGIAFAIMGPAACTRKVQAWKTGACGADWLVVQYSQDGGIIATWELDDKSIGNEENSDGIYFTDGHGNVVHLSGHYIYVELEDKKDEVRELLLGKEPETVSRE